MFMAETDQFSVLTGTLFAGETAEENESHKGENRERLRRGVVFDGGDFEILFNSGIGGYLPLEDNHLRQEDGHTIYYPYYNETVAEVDNPRVDTSDMEVVQETVSLLYKVVDGRLFVKSQSEVPAYSPLNLVVNGKIYSVESPFMHEGQGYDGDLFLGLESRDDTVLAEDLQTGVKMPVDREMVVEMLDSEDSNGCLEVRDPEQISNVYQAVESLEQ